MNKQDIAEQSYKNGYVQGVKDFAKKLKELSQVQEVKTIFGGAKIYYIGDEGLNEIAKEITEEGKCQK